MPDPTLARETHVLLDGFGMGESPRWHDGRLWFSSWGTDEIVAVDLDGADRDHRSRRWWPRMGDGMAPRWAHARHRRRAHPHRARRDPCPTRRPAPRLAVRLERDDRRRTRQRLRQHAQLRLRGLQRHPRERQGAGEDRPGDAGRRGPRGGLRPGLPERHGRDAGQCHADRRRIVRCPADRIRHRPRREPLEPTRVGRRHGRRDLPRRRRRRVDERGRIRTTDRSASACGRAARSWIGSSSTAPATRACWGARTVGACSWSWRGGSVPTGWPS